MSVRRIEKRNPQTGLITTVYKVDVEVRLPTGEVKRARKESAKWSRREAERYEREVRSNLLANMPASQEANVPPPPPVPTIADFFPRFIDHHCRAERHKPSGIDSKECIFRLYLNPLLGTRRLDGIFDEDIALLKKHLASKSPSTANNVLTVLSKMLDIAVEWKVIERKNCRIKLLKRIKNERAFYEFDQFDRLVAAAHKIDSMAELVVLLGGEAGLRRGEIIALDWNDVDLVRRSISIAKSEWRGQLTPTKGLNKRNVPMTSRLHAALTSARNLRRGRVVTLPDGSSATARTLRHALAAAQKRAQLPDSGGLHILRHTFCSHLAMRGAAPVAIQRLAGHQEITTTMLYMHLAPSELTRAIALLDAPVDAELRRNSGNSNAA